ncbi:MAG: MFS transporter [Candidatus Omnitrophica bacterium]|nr:MFS transporter [Candidatus Omnitrophota bacterium]
MFSSLKVRNFRIYWFGMLVSLIGTWIQAVAQSWLVFQLTNSAFLLGVVGFLSSVPVFVLSLFGGVLADRVNKRNILIFTQTAFMLLAFVLAVLTYLKLITTGQIMLIAVLNGVVMAFDAPSRQSVVVELVGKKHLSNAIALSSVAFNSSRIIGPAIAGLLVSYIGMSGCFFVNGISFFAVIIALLLIKIDNGKVPNKNKKAWHDLIEGVVFIRNNRLILLLIMIVGVMSLFGVSYVILMPIFANQVLNVGVRGLGVLMSGVGFGALIGALMLARLGDFRYKGKFLVGSIFIFSFSLIVFSLSRNYIFSIIVLSFLGGSSVTAMALINTLLQTRVNDELRGRVMSMFMLTFAGIMPFGNLIAGSLSQIIGVSSAVLVSGIVCTAMFAMINFFYPDIRKI